MSAYPNDFSRSDIAARLAQQHASADADELERRKPTAAIAGRLMSRSLSPGASTGVVQDLSGRIAIVVSDEATGKANHAAYATWQAGDILGVHGTVCRLPSGDLAVRAHELRRLVAATRPLEAADADGAPRYLRLLIDERLRRTASLRFRLIQAMREFLVGRAYMEVETPLLHAAPAGPKARFTTHHNALGREFELRHCAASHLKMVLIGGVEQVFEINRRFINGDAAAPCEETVMDVYCAYSNDSYMVAMVSGLLTRATRAGVLGSLGGEKALTAPYARTTVADAIRAAAGASLSDAQLRDAAVLRRLLRDHGRAEPASASWGRLQRAVFETLAAPRLADATIVVDFPADPQSDARRQARDPELAEYFALFAGGLRVAEGRSVQNDPEAVARVASADDDRDFLRALEYGMPPASGLTVSIDRLVLALSGDADLTDAVVFPSLWQKPGGYSCDA